MSVFLWEDDIPGSSLAGRNPAELTTEELGFGSNAETIQRQDCGSDKSSTPLNYSSDRSGTWMFTLFPSGRSLLNLDCCIFSVYKCISQKKGKFLVDPDPNLLLPNETRPARMIVLAQMPLVLLSVFRLTTTVWVFLNMEMRSTHWKLPQEIKQIASYGCLNANTDLQHLTFI